MVKFTQILNSFINGFARSKLSLVGVIMTTATVHVLLIGVLLELFSLIHHQYFGFVLYLFVTPVFLLGLFTHECLSDKLSVPEILQALKGF